MEKRHRFYLIVFAVLLAAECAVPAGPVQALMPAWSPEPAADMPTAETALPTATAEPYVAYTEPPATPADTPEPTVGPTVKRLKKVSDVKLARYSTNSVKVTWKRVKKAKYYRVYCAKKRDGRYRLAGITKDTHYLVGNRKNHRKYYFYVTAVKSKKKKALASESPPSGKVSMKMLTFRRKIIFAGDSITQGIGYKYFTWHMSGIKKTVAYRGLNTVTFHTRRIFNGKTGLQKVIAEKPYRVYMMMGVNEIHYRRCSDMIAEYRAMVKAIQQACPDTDIVLCAIAPVTAAERGRHKGFSQISVFNRKLRKLADQTGTHYLDYTAFLKDSGGNLKAEYAERDGYHWKPPAYGKFARIVEKFERKLDR